MRPGQHSVSHLTSGLRSKNTPIPAACHFDIIAVIQGFFPQPFDLTVVSPFFSFRPLHYIMEHDSPDWDDSPTGLVEIKDEVHDTTVPQPTEPLLSTEVKFETTKKEEDSPPHSNMLCPPVSSLPDKTSTTPTPPPSKAPPVSHKSYRNLSTRTTSPAISKTTSTQHTAAAPHHTAPPPPPSTTSSTSTEDPVILTTNVPILPKARPGHPPLNSTWVGPPHSHHLPQTTPLLSHTHSAAPTRVPLRVTIPRPRRNGHLLPFNFSSDIKHYLNPTAHPTRRPLSISTPSTPCPAPPSQYQPITTTNTTSVFPPVPPIPDVPLTEQQAATLQQAILRIARQAAAAAAAELNSR